MSIFYDRRDPFHNKSKDEKFNDCYKPKTYSDGINDLITKLDKDKVTVIRELEDKEVKEIEGLVGDLDLDDDDRFHFFEVKVADGSIRERFEYYRIHRDLGIVEDEQNSRYIIEARGDFGRLVRGQVIEVEFKHILSEEGREEVDKKFREGVLVSAY